METGIQVMVQRMRISLFEKIGVWKHGRKSRGLKGWKKEKEFLSPIWQKFIHKI